MQRFLFCERSKWYLALYVLQSFEYYILYSPKVIVLVINIWRAWLLLERTLKISTHKKARVYSIALVPFYNTSDKLYFSRHKISAHISELGCLIVSVLCSFNQSKKFLKCPLVNIFHQNVRIFKIET